MKYQKIKNNFEPFIGLLLFTITFPLQILIFIVVLIELKKFPLFIQERGITLSMHRFKIYKFRTIKDKKKNCYENNVFNKNYLYDSVPQLCRILRKSGLDELPQLLNVIKGEMSLIGPRPLSIEDLVSIKTFNKRAYLFRYSLKSKPGITGLWQVFGDRKKEINNLIDMERYYEGNMAFKLDLIILLVTLYKILSGQHSDAIISNSNKLLQDNFINKFCSRLQTTNSINNRNIMETDFYTYSCLE